MLSSRPLLRQRHSRRSLLAGTGAALVAGCTSASRQDAKAADVAVIGAGLAGLECALRLEAEGARVVVLEASDRVGGRAFTARDLPDRAEYGGIQVGDTYAYFRDRATRLDVAIGAYPHAFPRPNYFVGDQVATSDTWSDSLANDLPDALRSLTPDRLLGAVTRRTNPLTDVLDWLDPGIAAEDVSLQTLLAEHGYDAQALRLANINANNNGLSRASALAVWRSHTLQSQARSSSVVTDGTDALTEAMAGALREPVVRNQTVRRVRPSGSGLVVDSASGRWQVDQLVVAVPPSAARRIEFDGLVPAALTAAWSNLPYTFITLIYVETAPFWETDGFSTYMWTDGLFERWFPRQDATTGETVGFKIWLNGAGALRADSLSTAELEVALAAELLRLRPASGGRLRVSRVMSWQQRGDYAGAYPEWPIGQTAELAALFGASYGRVHLAGDYTSKTLTGLEGAVASGAQAATRILQL